MYYIVFLLLLCSFSSHAVNAEELVPEGYESYLEEKVKKEDADAGTLNVIHLYKPNYFLFYDHTDNIDASAYPGKTVANQEMKAQFSIIIPVQTDIFSIPTLSYGFSYTQLMYLQDYNDIFSTKPFMRDIDYGPSFYARYMLNPHILMSFAWDHRSNGVGDRGERFINKLTGSGAFSYGPLYAQLSAWYIISPLSTYNIGSYLGFTAIDIGYQIYKFVITAHMQNVFESKFARGQFIFSISHPLFSPKISIYAQYFNGYDQSMTSYNQYTQSYGIGLALNDLIP